MPGVVAMRMLVAHTGDARRGCCHDKGGCYIFSWIVVAFNHILYLAKDIYTLYTHIRTMSQSSSQLVLYHPGH